MFVFVGTQAIVIGGGQSGRHEQMHELRSEPRSCVKARHLSPGRGAHAGFLLQLAPRRQIGIFDRAVLADIQGSGRNLQQQLTDRDPILPDEEHAIVGIDRQDRHRARVTGDLTGAARAIRSFDRVDSERQIVAAVDDLRLDDALDEIGPGDLLRGR